MQSFDEGTCSREQVPIGFLAANGTRDAPAHGAYVGFEWELGQFRFDVGPGSVGLPLDIVVSVKPLTELVTPRSNQTLLVPSTYYGVFVGDLDDGGNSFKRWFWDWKVVRSLHDNANEPWTEICYGGEQPQAAYNALASSGIEAVKMDVGWYNNRDWQFRPADWPHGFDFGQRAKAAGMNSSLYMGGTYLDCNLSTIACRDSEFAALANRYDEGWMTMWRTDTYTAPENPMPDTFQGVTNFLHIVDTLATTRPGFRYENCANGGRYKGFSTVRRFTFMTTNDQAMDGGTDYRASVWVDGYVLNPIQLKSDVQLLNYSVAFMSRTSMLGSIMLCCVDEAPCGQPGEAPAQPNAAFRQHVALYKARQRPILRGGSMYHILPKPDGMNWDGFQFYNRKLRQGSVFLFKPAADAASSKRIFLKGLDRATNYSLEYQDRVEQNVAVASGAELMDRGVLVSGLDGVQASEIIWIRG